MINAVLAVSPSAGAPGLEEFGHDPWWLVLLKAVLIFVLLVVLTLFNIWFERRVVARMQHRIGPNVNGPFGLLQSLADGVKLALKEDIIPTAADKVVFLAAPVIATIPAFVTFSVIPFGPVVTVPFSDIETPLQLTDMPVAVLFVMAIASVGIYGIVLGGWSSGSTYSLLGGLRSSAQMISYEVSMGLALVAVFLYAGSMSTSQIVAAQDTWWFGLILAPSFVIYTISMVGETNRAPFDLPEAEGELVGGFHTEYSSLKFALFFLAEYINMATVAALATTLFLGGWHAPFWIDHVWAGANSGYWPFLWFMGKVHLLHLHLHLAARHPAPASLRPVHGLRLEAADPVLAAVDHRRRVDPHRVARRRRRPQVPPDRPGHRRRGVPRCVLLRRPVEGRRGGARGDTPGLRRWVPGPADAGRWRRPRPGRRPDVRHRPHGRGRRGGPDSMSAPQEGKTLKEQLWDPVAGFGVTFRTMFKKVVTEQYPFEKEPTAPRFHGRHQLNRWPDGLEKCIGCELCAWACPADAIYVEGASNSDGPDGERFSPGERYGRVYQINYLRCILCGLCIEACPTRALTMTNEYELADDNRADLIYEKSDLLAPLLPGMEQPPHPMRLGDDEGDYYRGTFKAAGGATEEATS